MKRKWLYSEAKLAEVTGLSRIQLKKCRIKGEWRHGQGKGAAIELSERGVQKVLQRFGIEDADLEGAKLVFGKQEAQTEINREISTDGTSRVLNQEQREPTLAPGVYEIGATIPLAQGETVSTKISEIGILPDLKLLKVSQLPPNKRILRAQNGSGEVYQVIVPSSLVWSIGDPLRAKESEKHKGYYELVGKAPRWRGDRIYRHEFV